VVGYGRGRSWRDDTKETTNDRRRNALYRVSLEGVDLAGRDQAYGKRPTENLGHRTATVYLHGILDRNRG